MPKNIKTPGTELKALLKEHNLNCNRLAKAINMSNAMVRLLVLGKSPVSIGAAFRLAKFFKTDPKYWLNLQLENDLAKAAKDKTLAKELARITDINKYSFVRKAHDTKTAKVKRGRKKTTLAGKRKAVKKAPRAKSVRRK
jgi:addiction module HigA family antidote